MSKLALECSKYLVLINENADEKHKNISDVWSMIMPKPLPLFMTSLFTLGGVCSAVLVAGLVFDYTLYTRVSLGDRYLCGFPRWLDFVLPCIVIFAVHQALLKITERRLKAKMRSLIGSESTTEQGVTTTMKEDGPSL